MSIVDKLKGKVADLIANDARKQLPGTIPIESASQTPRDTSALIFLASWFATTQEQDQRELAYEIATRIIASEPSEVVTAACTEILIRLGNFPAVDLTTRKHGSFEETLPLHFAIENAAKRIVNTVAINGSDIQLTDFQIRAEQYLSSTDHDLVSISAPTSAGKSFLLSLDVVRRFSAQSPRIRYACFIVPTRALSRQIASKIRENLATHGVRDVSVRVLPPRDETELPERSIFVFTQERLLSLLGETSVALDALYVDEAQGISDGSRGVLLQQSIEQTLAKSPRCRVVVIAPMVKNPEIFGAILRTSRSVSFPYTESLVTQNVFVAEPVHGKPKASRFRLKSGDSWVDLGVRTLGYNFRPTPRKTKTVARFAIDVTANEDVTLVYSTGPSDAEKVAEDIAEELPDAEDETLHELAAFVREEVHPSYSLAATLTKGVAFHYSMMPSLIRNRIEELVEDGAVKFVSATTTLLSGVNLPLKNLVIASPKKGSAKSMTGFEFWNLSGRAGRLGKEFHGNIWILKLDEWPDDVFEGGRQIEVESAFETALRSEPDSILSVLRSPDAPTEDEGSVEAAASKIFYDVVSTGVRFADSQFARMVPSPLVTAIDNEIDRLREIPVSVAKSAAGLSPSRTLALWREMRGHSLSELLPIHPLRTGSYERLRNLIALLQRTLMGDETQTYKYLAKVASDWIQESHLNAMIADKIAWDSEHSKKRDVHVSASVRELLKTIETKLRHIAARNFRVFAAALQEICIERRQINVLRSAAPISMFLDSGAFREETLALLSLGFSRSSAIRIANTIVGQGQAGVAKLMSDDTARSRLAAHLPKVCMEEVKRIARST